MRCHLFLKRVANSSLNDARDQVIDQSIERSQIGLFNNQYCLPLAHHYESKNCNQKELKQI